MKHIHLLLAMLLAASLHAKANDTMVLTPKQQALAAIAGNEAKGNIEELKKNLDEGFEQGLTISEAKEALSHLYAYTGFPRSLNALSALQQVIKEREAAGKKTEAGREADSLPAGYDALMQGTEVQTKLTGHAFNYDFAPQTDYYLKAHLFGDIFARNNLTFAEREIVTVSAISSLTGCEPQLLAHINGAKNMGVSDSQIRAIPSVLRAKVGEKEALRAKRMIARFFGETEPQAVSTVDFTIWPKGEPNSAYSQYFTGNSYLAPMGAVSNVTFEPGCRNNWHIHHKAVQVLICVSGRGWYQEWGKEAVPMTPGTVIAVPAEVKHWHGAAKDSWFQHLTYHKDVQEGSSNEWLEPVTDEVYGKLE